MSEIQLILTILCGDIYSFCIFLFFPHASILERIANALWFLRKVSHSDVSDEICCLSKRIEICLTAIRGWWMKQIDIQRPRAVNSTKMSKEQVLAKYLQQRQATSKGSWWISKCDENALRFCAHVAIVTCYPNDRDNFTRNVGSVQRNQLFADWTSWRRSNER